jgi:hypothetical protein
MRPATRGERVIIHERSSGFGAGCAIIVVMLVLLVGAGVLAVVLFTDLGKQITSPIVQLTDAQRIVGKWQEEGKIGCSMEFLADGRCQELSPLKNTKGTYTLQSGQRIDMKLEGWFYGHNQITWRYELTSDTLVLSQEGGAGMVARYRRVR